MLNSSHTSSVYLYVRQKLVTNSSPAGLLIGILFTLLLNTPITYGQTVEFAVNDIKCSGFIARLSSNSQTAYLVTAGHCLPGLMDEHEPDRKLQNIPFPQTGFSVHILDRPKDANPAIVKSQRIVLASIQNVDVAILKLDESVSQLDRQGIRPLLIGVSVSREQGSVSIQNAITDEHVDCEIENSSAKPMIRKWRLTAAARLGKACRLGPGWSGAPVLGADGDVIGIISGGNDTGTSDDFHEFDDEGKNLIFKNQGYFSYLSFLSKCTDNQGTIHPEKCILNSEP